MKIHIVNKSIQIVSSEGIKSVDEIGNWILATTYIRWDVMQSSISIVICNWKLILNCVHTNHNGLACNTHKTVFLT